MRYILIAPPKPVSASTIEGMLIALCIFLVDSVSSVKEMIPASGYPYGVADNAKPPIKTNLNL